ncbi:MAG: hypothetical protein R3D98_10400 [Candidatus Krumholzibacteriia bacterium]
MIARKRSRGWLARLGGFSMHGKQATARTAAASPAPPAERDPNQRGTLRFAFLWFVLPIALLMAMAYLQHQR